ISDILGGFVIVAQWLLCSTVVLESGLVAEAGCGLMKMAQILSYYVSSLAMTAIAYDRFQMICRPMSGRANSTFLIALVWTLGILFIGTNFMPLRVNEYFSPNKVS